MKSKKLLKKSSKIKLGRSFNQLQAIVDNSYDAIIGETLEGVITSWNKGAERMFGYTAKEVVGKSSRMMLPPEVQEEIISLFEKIKRGEVVADYDTAILHKNGSKVDVAISISPIKDDKGKIVGASVVERDITRRKKMQQLKIKELNQVRSKFISIISHQLRTPLTAINWNLEALLAGSFGKLDDVQREFLEATHESSVKITWRIGTLLTAMDIEEGRIVFDKEPIVLDNICWEVINQLARRSQIKNISYNYALIDKDLPEVEGDAEKIRRVIVEFMENAVIYTKRNGMIAAKLERKGNSARFEVKDNGIGIPLAEQGRIFTRFFRASNAATMHPDGFGLGLYVAKNFIEQQGGKIGFESREGEGSTFWFELPLIEI